MYKTHTVTVHIIAWEIYYVCVSFCGFLVPTFLIPMFMHEYYTSKYTCIMTYTYNMLHTVYYNHYIGQWGSPVVPWIMWLLYYYSVMTETTAQKIAS